VHNLEAKVDGTYKMSFTNFGTGSSHSFGGRYLELEPGRRIRHTEACYLGWQESLTLLAQLVEPVILDEG